MTETTLYVASMVMVISLSWAGIMLLGGRKLIKVQQQRKSK